MQLQFIILGGYYAEYYAMRIMGSGKTTVGKALAKMLNYVFIDTDAEIEKRAGIKISEIFEKLGEAAFRQMESDIIKELAVLIIR